MGDSTAANDGKGVMENTAEHEDWIDVEVGRRLRAFRLAKGMSQATLAEHAGISFQQVQRYEAGTNRISASRMCSLADKLGVSPAALFPPGVLGEEEVPNRPLVLTEGLKRVVEAFAALPPARQVRLARLVYLMLKEVA